MWQKEVNKKIKEINYKGYEELEDIFDELQLVEEDDYVFDELKENGVLDRIDEITGLGIFNKDKKRLDLKGDFTPEIGYYDEMDEEGEDVLTKWISLDLKYDNGGIFSYIFQMGQPFNDLSLTGTFYQYKNDLIKISMAALPVIDNPGISLDEFIEKIKNIQEEDLFDNRPIDIMHLLIYIKDGRDNNKSREDFGEYITKGILDINIFNKIVFSAEDGKIFYPVENLNIEDNIKSFSDKIDNDKFNKKLDVTKNLAQTIMVLQAANVDNETAGNIIAAGLGLGNIYKKGDNKIKFHGYKKICK